MYKSQSSLHIIDPETWRDIRVERLSTDKTKPRDIASGQGTKCFPHHVIVFASLDRSIPRYVTVRHLANEAPSVCHSILTPLSLRSSNNSIPKEATMAEDIQVKREITLEADAETLEKMRKEGGTRKRFYRLLR